MDKVYIDDNIETTFGKCESLSDLASKIAAKKTDNTIFFINVNLKFHESKRSEQTGIELLIWLRMKDVMNHCILHSFETTHALLTRQPQYLIGVSKGTSFVQQPIVLEEIDTTKLVKNFAQRDNLKLSLKPIFNIDKYRHREANLWGIQCLWDVHKQIDTDFTDDYPEQIKISGSSTINSLIPLLYFNENYSKGFPNTSILNKILIQVRFLHSIKPLPRVILIDDQANDGWGKIFSKIIYGNNDDEIIKSYYNTFAPKKSDTVNSIFKAFSGIVTENLKTGNFIDLLIMDLRLLDEVGVRKDVHNISGIELFKRIRFKYKNIPILIITASNKANVFAHLYELRDIDPPNGFWIKEGIDFHNFENDKLHNYLLLASQLNQLIKKKRNDKFVRAIKLDTFTNDQNRIKELEVVNNGFPEVKDNIESLIFNSHIQKKYNQAYCIIDTNIFIKSNLADLFNYSQTVILLSNLRNRFKYGKIGVHLNVFAEILKFGMSERDELLNLVARKSHKNLQTLYTKKELEIIIPNAYLRNPEKLEVVITGSNPYADDALYNKCKALLELNNTLIFISDDKKKDGTAKQLEAFLTTNPKLKSFCKIIDGQELVSDFRPYLETLVSYDTT